MVQSISRRLMLRSAVALTALGCLRQRSEAVDVPGSSSTALTLDGRFSEPVKIAAIEQLLVGESIWMRVRSEDGRTGYCPGNDRLKVTLEMAKQLIFPFFLGKDARNIESLVDGVYTVRDERGSVYKFAGMPFWNIVGHVEIAILDLLSRSADVPLASLIGGAIRQEIPVYISQFGRTTTPQVEVDNAARDLEKTGASATKLKVGLRMANSKAQMRRDRRMIELARKRLGDKTTIYVDANSSYTVAEAIEMGHFFDDYGVAFFEEPVPWQDYRGTQAVTEALSQRKIQIAGGEQDSNLWQWQAMVDERMVDIVQPDVFYNGGILRTLRVARMAAAKGIPVTPHSPKVLPVAAGNLQLCSVLPNPGPYQEYRSYGKVTNGVVKVPDGPGLGVELDNELLAREKVL
ncbi:MAG TPA: mandelate racemase/muconate lactonizing enzyme family protein [Planctomycetaceae bacterium]|nr:mandelate racemase/muconate lactonizing enzyme family protein [Planctomycetaceae bacterium]